MAKAQSMVDYALLEHCLREDLNKRAPRTMAVLRPLKIVLTNYPEGRFEEVEATVNPEDPSAGTRMVPFGRELWIEREDFMEDPPKKFFRLAPGREIRLKYAYYVTCNEVIKDPSTGEITELHCTYDPETKGGWSKDGRKVKGTSHWVSAAHAHQAEFRLYDRLFKTPSPDEGSGMMSEPQPGLARSHIRVYGGRDGWGASRHVVAVRTPGLFHARFGLQARRNGLQPVHLAEGFLGQDQSGLTVRRETTVSCVAPPGSNSSAIVR